MEPRVLSVYRGQARTGIGEGPNVPVSHGEQYLLGTSESLRDGDLLQSIRPWASLDSDPADHQRLKDRLEAWSCFPTRFQGGDWVFVTRLVSAGLYDRRAAYFSHTRAFRLDAGPRPFDPGAYLGCSRVFDAPERAGTTQAELAGLNPSAVPGSWLDPLNAEADTARRFLGHLLQALELDYPLIVAVPVREFTPGSALFALMAFARAALPGDLKDRCAVRLYTRHPQRFLRQLGANLVALPDDTAGDALAARRDATLLDRGGQVKAGRSLDPSAEAYADGVLAGVLQEPRGLLPFSTHLHSRGLGGRPLGADRRLLQLVYNLAGALAMATDERDFDYLFRRLLRAQARGTAGLPWDELLRTEDWSKFPAATLGEFVLEPTEGLTAGERELRDVIVRRVQDRTAMLDSSFARWWEPRDPGKRTRLLALLNAAPSLFSPAVVGTRTAEVPLAQWLGLGSLQGLLEAEYRAGVLRRRAVDRARLAELAAIPENFRVLLAALDAGQLPPDWAVDFLGKADDSALYPAVRAILDQPRALERWNTLGVGLLDRLRGDPRLPDDLLQRLADLGTALDFRTHWEIYLRMADLLARADPESSARPAGNALLRRIREGLDTLDRPEQRARLVEMALDPDWSAMGPDWLVTPDGRPAIPWWREAAERLLSSDRVLELLNTEALLDMPAEADPPVSAAAIRRAYRAVTAHWRRDATTATGHLVRARAWLGWRREAESSLTREEKKAAAWAWLCCPVWHQAGVDAPEATFETFTRVTGDLEALSGPEMQRLVRTEGVRGPLWPWIRRCENRQIAAFARLAGHLGALVELAEAMTGEFDIGIDHSLESVFGCSRYGNSPHSWETLRWLRDDPPAGLPALSLPESRWLLEHAGHRREQAVRARIRSVLAQMDSSQPESLDAADQPEALWPQPEFTEGLAEWLCRTRDFSEAFLKSLDRRIDLQRMPRLPFSEGRAGNARWMADKGYRHIAGLLDRDRYQDLSTRALVALRNDGANDPVWGEIRDWRKRPLPGDSNGGYREAAEHPLSELARRNWGSHELSERPLWRHFMNAARNCPDLLRHSPHPEPRLPAFELAAGLHRDHLKNATLLFVKAVTTVLPELQKDPEWWRGLIRSARTMTSRESNSVDIVLNTIVQLAQAQLDHERREALAAALQAEAKPDHARILRMQTLSRQNPK